MDYDTWKTTPPDDHDCAEDGHEWKVLGRSEDETFLKCKRCGAEDQQ